MWNGARVWRSGVKVFIKNLNPSKTGHFCRIFISKRVKIFKKAQNLKVVWDFFKAFFAPQKPVGVNVNLLAKNAGSG